MSNKAFPCVYVHHHYHHHHHLPGLVANAQFRLRLAAHDARMSAAQRWWWHDGGWWWAAAEAAGGGGVGGAAAEACRTPGWKEEEWWWVADGDEEGRWRWGSGGGAEWWPARGWYWEGADATVRWVVSERTWAMENGGETAVEAVVAQVPQEWPEVRMLVRERLQQRGGGVLWWWEIRRDERGVWGAAMRRWRASGRMTWASGRVFHAP